MLSRESITYITELVICRFLQAGRLGAGQDMKLVCADARTVSLELAFDSLCNHTHCLLNAFCRFTLPRQSPGRFITPLEIMVVMERQPDQIHVSAAE